MPEARLQLSRAQPVYWHNVSDLQIIEVSPKDNESQQKEGQSDTGTSRIFRRNAFAASTEGISNHSPRSKSDSHRQRKLPPAPGLAQRLRTRLAHCFIRHLVPRRLPHRQI